MKDDFTSEQMKAYLEKNFEEALQYLESINQGELLRKIKDDESFTVRIQFPNEEKGQGNQYENDT